MGLTMLISRKEPVVTIIQWFTDPALRLDLACGPLLRLSLDQFRLTGYGIVRRHFVEYKTRRVSTEDVEPLYPPKDERRFRRFLADQRPIEIGEPPPAFLQ